MLAILEDCVRVLRDIYDIVDETEGMIITPEERDQLKDIIAWCIGIINRAQEVMFKINE